MDNENKNLRHIINVIGLTNAGDDKMIIHYVLSQVRIITTQL